jgi:hypothetical protein
MPVGRADALLPDEAPLPVALLPVLVPAAPVVVPLLMPELPLVPEPLVPEPLVPPVPLVELEPPVPDPLVPDPLVPDPLVPPMPEPVVPEPVALPVIDVLLLELGVLDDGMALLEELEPGVLLVSDEEAELLGVEVLGETVVDEDELLGVVPLPLFLLQPVAATVASARTATTGIRRFMTSSPINVRVRVEEMLWCARQRWMPTAKGQTHNACQSLLRRRHACRRGVRRGVSCDCGETLSRTGTQ